MNGKSFLDAVCGYVDAAPPTSADKPVKLATIDPGYTTGSPKVTFDGESTLSGKGYAFADSYVPKPNDRVVMLPVGSTWVILGSVGGAGTVPVGSIQMYAGSSAPVGYLLCYGQAVSRTTYAALFSAIGTTYGAGDGSTTFNVPNMLGRVAAGYDWTQAEFNVLGKTGGEKTHTLTNAEMPVHGHGGSTGNDTPDHSHNQSTGHGGTGSGGIRASDVNSSGSGVVVANTVSNLSGATARHIHPISNDGGGGAHNNLQPYLTVNYLIKY